MVGRHIGFGLRPQHFESILAVLPNGLAICDAQKETKPVVYVNPAFERFSGLASSELTGIGLEQLNGLLQVADGSQRKAQPLQIIQVKDHSNRITHLLALLSHCAGAAWAEDPDGPKDDLTGLDCPASGDLLPLKLLKALHRAKQEKTLCAVLHIFLDIGGGGAEDSRDTVPCDEILVEAACRLNEDSRHSDMILHAGGHEFVVLLTAIKDVEQVRAVCKRLLAELGRPYKETGESALVSIGVSLYPRDHNEPAALLAGASAAMRQARAKGGGQVCFTGSSDGQCLDLETLVGELRKALENGQFELHYQPKVDLHNGMIAGFEALIRWRHPERGLMPPGLFIPAAEQSGLIVPIGHWVLRSACEQNRRWQHEGLAVVPIAVNVSARQFEDAGLTDAIEEALAGTGLAAKWLELELTESTVMKNPEQAYGIFSRLKAMGVQMTVDDFGTGYSSLAYIQRLPFDHLKIDRSFVKDVVSNAGNASIVRAIIAMARSLGLKVIAEGIEDAAQLHFLRRCGCDEIQGFYFSRPVVAADARRMLQEERPFLDQQCIHEQMQRTLLILDDEPAITGALQRVLRKEGYRIRTADSPSQAFEIMAMQPAQVIISDHQMPEMTGVEFLDHIKRIYPQSVRLLLTGHADQEMLSAAINRSHIYKFITKPWDIDELRSTIRSAFSLFQNSTG